MLIEHNVNGKLLLDNMALAFYFYDIIEYFINIPAAALIHDYFNHYLLTL